MIEYTTCTNQDPKKTVAYLFKNYVGTSLVIKCDDGWMCFYGDHDTPKIWSDFHEDRFKIIHKFYPGDKITITF